MIEIPFNANSSKRKQSGENLPCVICGKPLTSIKYEVWLWWGSHLVTKEEGENLTKSDPNGDTGAYPVGSDCLRRHPEVRPYVIRRRR